MAASALLMAVGATVPAPAVIGLVVFMLGFEFAIVSLLPVAANIVPGASGAGLGMAVGAGTSGRAVLSFVSPFLYDRVGPVAPVVLALLMAVIAAGLVSAHSRAHEPTTV